MNARAIGLLLGLCVPSLAGAEIDSGRGARVLAVVGEIPGTLRAGERLAPGSALVVPAGSTVQLELGAEAVLAILGPARGRLSGRGAELFEAEAARLAGPAVLVVPGGYRVEPGARGSVVYERGQLHLTAGEARVTAPRGPAVSPDVMIRAPGSVRLGLGGELLAARGGLSEETWQRLGRFAPPPSWRHGLGPVSAAEVNRAVETMRAERQRERQLASCGCTESKSGTAGQLPGSTGLSPIERSASTLRVKITGIPRSAP